MKITTKGRYGLRLMLDLAGCYGGQPVALKEIARRQDISEKYLEQIIQQLNRAGLISSVRGAHGGYSLSRSPQDISVGDILRSVEVPLAPVECADDIACERSGSCAALPIWKEIKEAVEQVVDHRTLADLLPASDTE